MKCLITGAEGQLGFDIVNELKKRNGYEYYAPSILEMNITNCDETIARITNYNPDVIFHCAAYTAVDKAEENKEDCFLVNSVGTKNIVDAAKKCNAKVVYISTDYVFDGTKSGEYFPEDKTNPINYYGYTKMCGEEHVKKLNDFLIIRISWVFGINGNNFVKTMLRLANEKRELSVVSDQIGSPTYTVDLAKILVDMIENNKKGIFHVTNEGYCSWNEFAKYIFNITNNDVEVNEILTKDYKTLAKRPINSRLNKDKLDEVGLERLPSWQDAVERFCRCLKEDNK